MKKKWEQALDQFEQGRGAYQWDELEELITEDFEEGKLSEEDFDQLMKRLMDMDLE